MAPADPMFSRWLLFTAISICSDRQTHSSKVSHVNNRHDVWPAGQVNEFSEGSGQKIKNNITRSNINNNISN